jgi:hypothetical protein
MEITKSHVEELNQMHAEIVGDARKTVDKVIALGSMLLKTKESVPYGEWGKWQEKNLDFSADTASRYIRCWESRSAIHAEKIVGLDQAYKLLASPPTTSKPENASKPEQKKKNPQSAETNTTNHANSKLSPEEQAQRDIEEASKPETNGNAEIVPTDAHGVPITEDALPYWNRKQEIQDLLTTFSRLKSQFKKYDEDGDRLFSCVRQSMVNHLQSAYTTLTNAMPYAICLECEGRPELNKCRSCHGTGLISKYAYEMYPFHEKKEFRLKLYAHHST